jgi:dynein heavy chain
MGKANPAFQLEVCKLSSSNLMRSIEMGVQYGKWILLENIGTEIDPSLEPILLQQKVRQGKGYVIKIGEKTLQYNEDFKFMMTTTLPNPHYSPETSVKVTILNFSITPIGLEEQMLNLLVLEELPELQEKKNEIVETNAKNAKILYDIEDSILTELLKTVAQLLENDDLNEKLDSSKLTSMEIAKNQAESKVTEKEIDETRESFRPVAFRASLLFFCIVDLNIIDPMYQYSLQWFQGLFRMGVKNSRDADADNAAGIERQYRIKQLNDFFSLSLYRNVCRSLFERHKLLFSFLLCTKILFGNK